ncbi:unnamed protein product [Rhizoctonia solani]|uniref:Uncharacterized protein n=2 Tax=Rhizoctonia solani TaxID=456999 RepID=A0A8H3BYC4_9AGAM|nr:ser-thr-rich glycosyl-phosphatidyl-inositol-anchored membrane family protein [Rhizoctonia solani 123E]CAE6466825.1 unnamed protein product [Rhizoctonia solani]CAE6505786.1 unnamed protein product [Rhizoctonia solani]
MRTRHQELELVSPEGFIELANTRNILSPSTTKRQLFKFPMIFLTSFLAFIAVVLAQGDPSINTPSSLVQCQPAQLTWNASNTPVYISIIPGGNASAPALMDLGRQSGTSTTWNVNITGGTSITFRIVDTLGVNAYSAPVTIQSSSNSSCIHK